MGVLVIAEPGMTWDRDLTQAFKLIDAAKACGSDVVKFQWTSSGKKLQERRQVDPKYVAIYERGVQYPREWLEKLKGHCDSVGIEFACTTYLIEDIAVVAPLVKRYKISAYESTWYEFVRAHSHAITSCNDLNTAYNVHSLGHDPLWCVSKYPTPVDALQIRYLAMEDSPFVGLSDHTANVLTGAAAVAAGARIVEAHIRLSDTEKENPDYRHSLMAGFGKEWGEETQTKHHLTPFAEYVQNIRTVERML